MKKNKLQSPPINNTDEVNLSLTNSDMLLREDNSNITCSFPCITVISADTSSQDLSNLILSADNSFPTNSAQCDNAIWLREKGLHIVHLNINHLYSKLDELKLHISNNNNIDCVCICGTFLNNTYSDSELHIREYVTFRKDRYSHGGGLLWVDTLMVADYFG